MLLVAVISAFVSVASLVLAAIISNATPFSNIPPVLMWLSGAGILVLLAVGVMYLISMIKKK